VQPPSGTRCSSAGRSTSPRRYGRWREETESNPFGTHEFLRFCRLCGVKPYLAANVGTGTAEEFQQWVEYCNAPAGATTLAGERVANGDPDPFHVEYWGVGDESWGCGGKFIPEDYCREYRRFVEWLPKYDTRLFRIAAGPDSTKIVQVLASTLAKSHDRLQLTPIR